MKRNVKAGIAIGFLSFLHNNKAMMIAGAIMTIVGAVVSAYLGSVLVQDYTSGNISPLDARPYPVYGIISPLYTQIAFIVIAMIGLGLLVWSVTGTSRAKP
ncbi:MAG TPA: hypothetical protein VE573_08065 [Nitrososphaeraceae archaeon]|jgi:hypothetical protein|nr:hypothetical protein [Nitrososphaeraceae archaeon]HJR47443.1 hypothetical protein [Nitrososphaeraceae archaeon]HZA62809.1 hypothetical protein [Nitrososphaeraceae archaeon]HZA70156.1 hypothetical protein [Nitrososphaeraceae archaeon]